MQQAQRDVRKLSLVPQFAGIDLEYIELQIVSLLHRLLWIFGGNAMPQPRNIDLNSIDFSPLRNLTSMGSFSGFTLSLQSHLGHSTSLNYLILF